jgi:hypothetical protein
MASSAIDVSRPGSAARPLFVATIFAGSFLLFLTQPMIARMALPRLGGAPAVWNSAMLVYQALLLAGYAYAHALGRFSPRIQIAAHLALLLAAALWLPLGLVAAFPPPDANPAFWTPWLLTLSIGPLFLAVSAQAPLMQRWFATARPGADPYPLYAASNLGSFGGLIAYPLLVEPGLTLASQSMIWTIGYVLLVLLVLTCAAFLPRRDTALQTHKPVGTAISTRRLAHWIALAAVPSGFMLAVTTHLTTDIVAMPLIWVMPLGLYLLSFSVAFAGNGRWAVMIQRVLPSLLIVMAGWVSYSGALNPIFSAGMDLALLFVLSVTLHHELYRSRPAPAQLTGFYLAMSVGGVLGGIFCAIIAPLLFDWVYEYPLLIAAAGLLIPREAIAPIGGLRARWICVIAAMLALLVGVLLKPDAPQGALIAVMIALAFLARAALANRAAFAICLVALMLGFGGWRTVKESLTGDERTRSYFGVYSVTDKPGGRALTHGTTIHGIQRLIPGQETMATSYYARRSGIGEAMSAAGPQARIGVVGLGAGTLACYARPGQDWRFYEIDPAIAAIARNPRQFTFLLRCLPHVPILIGDARLTLAAERGPPLDLLAVDAFSSDAVPMHLLTLEAMEVYRRRLAADGLLMIHISNRFMDIEPVLGEAAARGGWAALLRDYQPSAAEAKMGATHSTWVAMARDPAALSALARNKGDWRPLQRRAGFPGWTDDYASILPLLKAFRPN